VASSFEPPGRDCRRGTDAKSHRPDAYGRQPGGARAARPVALVDGQRVTRPASSTLGVDPKKLRRTHDGWCPVLQLGLQSTQARRVREHDDPSTTPSSPVSLSSAECASRPRPRRSGRRRATVWRSAWILNVCPHRLS
jgi:hypothetical protein